MVDSTNLRYWEVLRTPPPEVLKPIEAGRLKGKSDISPQWRLKAMTELFGPCGIGWKYEKTNEYFREIADGQIVAFVDVNVCIKVDGEWSAPIPGTGGNMLVEQESKGLHVNDEALKMAMTDALSVALKALGVAADVYAGQMDDSKYQDRREPYSSSPQAEPATPGDWIFPIDRRYKGRPVRDVSADYLWGFIMNPEKFDKEDIRERVRAFLDTTATRDELEFALWLAKAKGKNVEAVTAKIKTQIDDHHGHVNRDWWLALVAAIDPELLDRGLREEVFGQFLFEARSTDAVPSDDSYPG